MAENTTALADKSSRAGVDAEAVLNSLASTVVVVDGDNVIRRINQAAEQLFRGSATYLQGQSLDALMPADSPILALVNQARRFRSVVAEYDVTLESPRIGSHAVDVQVSCIPEEPDAVAIVIQLRSIAEKINHQLNHMGAARSVTAMAAMLAHEVKNPLSGIRGAAQLLEQGADEEDKKLTTLICDEADRIVGLVDRMEVFSDRVPLQREAVNIHKVLDRVQRLAETGFGSHVRFHNQFDPSLPPVWGNHDQLVQVFLNLVKNAAEAVGSVGGEITLGTAYSQGVRFALPGLENRVHLPLTIWVRDNGPGIPDDMKRYMFDAFVTSKPKGSGLGLALVAKIIGDHGGVIEFDSIPGRTVFRIMLPMFKPEDETGGKDG
ncbi:MAG: PAS domain-containing protein [Rhodospirillales bacterium]|nr:PAS domain-containing protein [Rhodospirillales bacterium]MBO6786831.1 PAS domain-containing protein [Rhodospirillales bacterium]